MLDTFFDSSRLPRSRYHWIFFLERKRFQQFKISSHVLIILFIDILQFPRRILKKATHRYYNSSVPKMGKGKLLLEGKSTRLFEPCIIVHGGAWKLPNNWKDTCILGVQDAAKSGYRKLLQVRWRAYFLLVTIRALISNKGCLVVT